MYNDKHLVPVLVVEQWHYTCVLSIATTLNQSWVSNLVFQARFWVSYLFKYAVLSTLFIRKLLFNSVLPEKPITRPAMWPIIQFVNLLFITFMGTGLGASF